jgi:hypothetical protein
MMRRPIAKPIRVAQKRGIREREAAAETGRGQSAIAMPMDRPGRSRGTERKSPAPAGESPSSALRESPGENSSPACRPDDGRYSQSPPAPGARWAQRPRRDRRTMPPLPPLPPIFAYCWNAYGSDCWHSPMANCFVKPGNYPDYTLVTLNLFAEGVFACWGVLIRPCDPCPRLSQFFRREIPNRRGCERFAEGGHQLLPA